MEKIRVKEVLYIPKLQIYVAKGRLILIPHELTDSMDSVLEDKDGNTWMPIVVSETEKPEIGEAMYHTTTKTIDKFVKGDMHCHKILALPEHFSEYHMQWFKDQTLKDGERVLVRCNATTGDAYVVALDVFDHVHIQTPYDYCELMDFYEWYKERNSTTRIQTLNELENRIGLPKQEYPQHQNMYTQFALRAAWDASRSMINTHDNNTRFRYHSFKEWIEKVQQ